MRSLARLALSRRCRGAGWVGVVVAWTSLSSAQDYSVLRINEVIAENDTRPPRDIGESTVDMVEIYNTGTEQLEVGTSNDNQSLGLSDTLTIPAPTALWTFRDGDVIFPGDSIIVFLDANEIQDKCEPHASFNLASDGSEPLTLWGPLRNGERQIIDQVWLPPLPADVSFGRSPDGAGPAPVPLEEVLGTFVFFPPPGPEGVPPGQSTLGSCFEVAAPCALGRKRLCGGGSNGAGGNIAPRVERLTFSTNNPAPGAPVLFTARVEDEKEPLPGNIASVEIVYRVDLGPENVVPMTHDGGPVIHDDIVNDLGEVIGTNPFNVWTIWEGSIPGQAQGALVDFFFRIRDVEGLSDTSPEMLCPDGVGPCHREFGGPGCSPDLLDVACPDGDPNTPDVAGERFIECRKRFSYTVGYEPAGVLAHVVINEVLARHDGIYLDATERECVFTDACPSDRLDCCKYRDDLIEIFNTSLTEPVDLSGKWLSSSPFGPEAWRFPPGSLLGPGEYIRVWLDNDGGKCPDPQRPAYERPCFWECPDPTNAAMDEYHANFSISPDDQIYLFDSSDANFGVIHGVAFTSQALNTSLTLVPDGDRNGSWIQTTPTILLPNPSVQLVFRRGDADGNCGVDITDGVYILNYLFTGGGPPPCLDAADPNDTGDIDITDPIYILNYLFLGTPAPTDPGPEASGPDPTTDSLQDCAESGCP